MNLDILTDIFSDYSTLIKYSIISLLFFYFVEGWNFTRIFIFIIVLLGVIVFMNYEKLNLNNLWNMNKNNNMNKNIENTTGNIKTIFNPIINDTAITKTIPEIKMLPPNLQAILYYTKDIRDEVKDPTYNKIINDLNVVIQQYVAQVDMLLEQARGIKEGSYLQMTYQNIKDIEKELYITIQALYFKVEVDQYMIVAVKLQAIEDAMNAIDEHLETLINADFKENPNCNKGYIYSSSFPSPFEK